MHHGAAEGIAGGTAIGELGEVRHAKGIQQGGEACVGTALAGCTGVALAALRALPACPALAVVGWVMVCRECWG